MFVLCQGFEYEGEAVLGVYSALSFAQDAAQRYADAFSARDYLCVYEIEADCHVDADALNLSPVWTLYCE